MHRFLAALAALSCVLSTAHAEESPIAERPVEAPGPLAPLKGTLTVSTAKPPRVAVIIPGSGPTNRDGDNPLGVRGGIYKRLAQALAADGISVVRIDKRGLFASQPAVADPNAVTLDDYATDTRGWIATALRETGAPCAWLIGHSEGGLIALVTAQDPKNICGLVLVSAPGRKLSDTLRAQLRANPANAPLLPQAMAAIDTLEAGQRVDASALPPPLAPLFNERVQGFLIDMFRRDPVALAGAYRGPMLVVSGERDLQVPAQDSDRLAKAHPGAAAVVIPAMNHVLKTTPSDDRAANLATYGNPDLPLADGLEAAIAGFIKQPR